MQKILWALFLPLLLTASTPKKLQLLYLEMDYCGWCKKMDREIFEDKNHIKELEKYFIITRLKKGSPKIPSFISTDLYPTTFILSSDGKKLIEDIEGYMKPSKYLLYLKTLYEIENDDEIE